MTPPPAQRPTGPRAIIYFLFAFGGAAAGMILTSALLGAGISRPIVFLVGTLLIAVYLVIGLKLAKRHDRGTDVEPD